MVATVNHLPPSYPIIMHVLLHYIHELAPVHF